MNIGGQFRVEKPAALEEPDLPLFPRRIGRHLPAGRRRRPSGSISPSCRSPSQGFRSFRPPWFSACLLGIIAVATAPAATLMVIREYEAEGPVTGTVLTLVGLNNLASILAFALAAHLLIRPGESLPLLAFRMLGPMLLGGLLGFLLSIAAQWLELSSERQAAASRGRRRRRRALPSPRPRPHARQPRPGDGPGQQLPPLAPPARSRCARSTIPFMSPSSSWPGPIFISKP